jgi:hypothetical protein
MSSKKIVVLGYMGACPIAGVIWLSLRNRHPACRNFSTVSDISSTSIWI